MKNVPHIQVCLERVAHFNFLVCYAVYMYPVGGSLVPKTDSVEWELKAADLKTNSIISNHKQANMQYIR